MTKVRLTREQKAEAYRNLPIAYIERPLKQIAGKLNYYDRKTKKTVISPIYKVAAREAMRGNPHNAIQAVARWAMSYTPPAEIEDNTEVQGA